MTMWLNETYKIRWKSIVKEMKMFQTMYSSIFMCFGNQTNLGRPPPKENNLVCIKMISSELC
jgi:hypothetical protein